MGKFNIECRCFDACLSERDIKTVGDMLDELATLRRQLAEAREGLEALRVRVYYYDAEERGIKVNRAPGWNGVTKHIDHLLARLDAKENSDGK